MEVGGVGAEEGRHDTSATNILRLNLLESLFRKAKACFIYQQTIV